MRLMGTVFTCLLLCLMLSGCSSYYQDGVTALEDGEYETAIENFTKEIEEERNVADSWRGIGLAYYEQGNYAQAAEALTQALDAGTQQTATLFGVMGDCQYSLGDYKAAISDYEKGLDLGDGSESLDQSMAFNIIAAYEQMGDYDSARERLKDYIERYPDDSAAAKEAEFLETQ